MKKAFDQTFRDIKREVNKKVLKVPGIEQKVLDATSNEPWGPHGSLLADIAQASRNQFEYQMIMSVIWKRLNDTGKNWRHVYKALIVLEFMVAHGSERVIDDIREHAYQISTLSDFQYHDSNGKDQGNNVRKKSQSLVAFVNDKERIQEARQKAAANRDKFRHAPMGGMYRPSSHSGTGGYGDRGDDDRYEGRYGNDDRNGYDREREWSNRDDDRHGRYRDSYGRDGKDSDERYSRDGYRDDDYRGRSRSVDDYHFTSRSRSYERDRDRGYEDERQYSYSGSGAKGDDRSPDGSFPGKPLERKFSEQNLAPPSYEEAVGDARSEKGGETSAASAPKTPTRVSSNSDQVAPAISTPPPDISSSSSQVAPTFATSTPAPTVASYPPQSAAAAAPEIKKGDGFGEFDPRGSYSGISTASKGSAEVDFLGSLSDSLAIVPVTPLTSAPEDDGPTSFSSAPSFAATSPASTAPNQPFEDPFGDGPFRVAQPQSAAASTSSSFHPGPHQLHNAQQHPSSNAQFPLQRSQSLPQTSYQTQPSSQQHAAYSSGFPAQTEPPPYSLTGFMAQPNHQRVQVQPGNNFYGNNYYMQQPGSTGPLATSTTQVTSGPSPLYNTTVNNNPLSRTSSTPLFQPPSAGPLALVPQPAKDKFELKSTVWADTLSRGLVDLNISGSKTNPMSDIGIDFEALNRKEKRMEKPSTTGASMVSTVTMGKAMGSGTGIGRAGASVLRPPQSPMVGPGGVGMGIGGGSGVRGYGGMNNNHQPMMGMGMGMNNNNMGINMGMGMMRPSGPQMQMQPPPGGFPSGYNNPMGRGVYAPQQPYGGGGYR